MELLTCVPRTVDEIEKLMEEGRKQPPIPLINRRLVFVDIFVLYINGVYVI
jgi:hypothetical protein